MNDSTAYATNIVPRFNDKSQGINLMNKLLNNYRSSIIIEWR